jgi:osmotically-inducible protein OsmY
MRERNDENPRDPMEESPRSSTDRGYDEAARSGPGRYGEYTGRGGVFGTTGGGTYPEGFDTWEVPELAPEGGGRAPWEPVLRSSEYVYARTALPYDQVHFDEAGPHTGRGPRGYERSDEKISEDVSDELWRHGAIDASELDVAVENGEVTLSGTVPERRMKRLTARVVETIPGVREVFNQIRVRERSEDR